MFLCGIKEVHPGNSRWFCGHGSEEMMVFPRRRRCFWSRSKEVTSILDLIKRILPGVLANKPIVLVPVEPIVLV
jgi:hypothetical protein